LGFRGEDKVNSCLFEPLEVVLADDMVEKAVSVVVAAAKTGKIGDGKVFVLSVEHAVRIRTEEIGEKAV